MCLLWIWLWAWHQLILNRVGYQNSMDCWQYQSLFCLFLDLIWLPTFRTGGRTCGRLCKKYVFPFSLEKSTDLGILGLFFSILLRTSCSFPTFQDSYQLQILKEVPSARGKKKHDKITFFFFWISFVFCKDSAYCVSWYLKANLWSKWCYLRFYS